MNNLLGNLGNLGDLGAAFGQVTNTYMIIDD
jgi:hypothetical protein